MTTEDIIFDLIDMRVAAKEDLTLHFNRLEAEALLAMDSDDCNLHWYARSVLKHLAMMKRSGAMLKLFPARADCEHAIEILGL